MIADPAEGRTASPTSPPVGVTRRYPRAAAGIDPDRDKGWLRRIAPVVMSHRLLFFGSMALALLAMLLQVAIPAVVRLTIDEVLSDSAVARAGADAEADRLWVYVAVLLTIGVIRGLLTLAYRYGLYRTAFEIDTDLRTLLYEHLTKLSFSFYDKTHSGQVISRANSDIRSVQMFLTFAPLISMTTVMFLVALAYMLSIHVWLTLVAVLPLPGVYLLGKRLRDQVFPLSWIVQARVADVATIVDENINGVRVVRSFAAERTQINELAKAATKLRWAGVKTVDARAAHNPVIENLPRIGTLLVLVYGGWLVIQGDVTEGTLFAFTAYVTMLQAPFRTLGLFLMLGQRARASADRIYEIFDEKPQIVDRSDAGSIVDPEGLVEFDDVRFRYDTEGPDVLAGFSLRVEPGETVALVGRTGSGKSTVARLLARFYDVTDGAIRVDGSDVRDVTQLSLRRAVGIVADEPFLFSVSLADNIAYGDPTAAQADIEAAAQIAQAHDFISALPAGYDEVVGERGYTLSGGQRQRVAIARTALVNPKIMVFDDATSAVDVTVEQRILDALAARREGHTTILIAHRLSTIAAADRVVLLDQGRVRAAGLHADLMATEPAYAEVLAHLEEGDEAPGPSGGTDLAGPPDSDGGRDPAGGADLGADSNGGDGGPADVTASDALAAGDAP
ncbi:MAG: ABC transporter ATP-binding protein [Acidimicrobiales bacterium]